MTVRRFLAAAAIAVLFGAQTAVAWAAGPSAYAGGARAPTQVVAVAAAKQRTQPKRQTGIFSQENTPLNLGGGSKQHSSASSGLGGGGILRTLLALVFVVAMIYVLAWVLRRVKRSREDRASGRGLAAVATLPLGNGRSLHLVRAGSDVILVGSSEHGVAPIHRYTEEEALSNGVLSPGGQEAVLRQAAVSLMPDGTPVPDPDGEWRTIQTSPPGSVSSILDVLRRMTVRS